MKITPREKRRHAAGREKNEGLQTIFLSPRRVSPFLAWGDFHARSRFARSTIPEEKWGPFLAWGDFHARSRFARSNIPEEKWGTTRSLSVAGQSG